MPFCWFCRALTHMEIFATLVVGREIFPLHLLTLQMMNHAQMGLRACAENTCVNESLDIRRSHTRRWIFAYVQTVHAQMGPQVCVDSACANGSLIRSRQCKRKWIIGHVNTTHAQTGTQACVGKAWIIRILEGCDDQCLTS